MAGGSLRGWKLRGCNGEGAPLEVMRCESDGGESGGWECSGGAG